MSGLRSGSEVVVSSVFAHRAEFDAIAVRLEQCVPISDLYDVILKSDKAVVVSEFMPARFCKISLERFAHQRRQQ